MTFCIALKCADGLVTLADTQIVRGNEQLTKGKIGHLGGPDDNFFVMTSGLRSVRDKLLIYVDEEIDGSEELVVRLYQAANIFGKQLRRIREEDGESLARAGLSFNAHAIIGGRLSDDTEPTLFYVYPEGNWIEVSKDSPWFMIGRTYYGKPILDRLMRQDVPLQRAAALALLAFDATQQSVTDVDFPIDIICLGSHRQRLRERRFDASDLEGTVDWWQQRLATALDDMPMDWVKPLLPDSTEFRS